MIISLIVAHGNNKEIGKNNQLLWKISEDLKNFKRLTQGKTLLMGRKTYESIGKPLPGRETLVMTRQKDWNRPCLGIVQSVQQAIDACQDRGDEELVICGGGEIYQQAMPYVEKIYLSEVDWNEPQADAFFSEISDDDWSVVESKSYPVKEKSPAWTFKVLERKA